MAIRLDDYVSKLPKNEQRAIKNRAAELIAEEASLRQVREAREQSQARVAERLGIKQAAVSRLERRADMYVSTLRQFIEAMGGKLDIVARFPGHDMRITQFSEIGDKSSAQETGLD